MFIERRSLVRKTLLAMAITAAVPAIGADARRSETEREALARAVQELQLIDAILADAERRIDAEARIYFDYSQLRSDLDAVKAGIAQYVDGERAQPREIPPIAADYVRMQGGE